MKLRGIVFLAAVSATAIAGAQTQYFTSYQVTLDVNQPVTNIMMLEEGDGFGSGTWAFTANGAGTTTLDNPFPSDKPVQSSLLIGLVQGLDTDANPDQKHIVLMMDPSAADLSNHIAWGTLFRNTDEDQLIADLELATSGQDWSIIQPGLDGISAFSEGDAKDGILGPGGIPQSAWFSTGGAFSVMTFSDGQQIGSGMSFVTQSNPVPEPTSFAAVSLGLAAIMRRRKSKASPKL